MGIDIRGIKQQLRASSKEYRRSLRLSEKVRMDEAIFKQVAALPEYQKAKLLLTYISTPDRGGDLSSSGGCAQKGKDCCGSPLCTGKNCDGLLPDHLDAGSGKCVLFGS